MIAARRFIALSSLVTAVIAITLSAWGCVGSASAQRRRRDEALDRSPRWNLEVASGVGDGEARERVAFIQRTLDEAAMPARSWRYGWLAGFGTLAVGSGLRALAFGPNQIAAGLVGATTSTLGVATVLFNDERAAHAGNDLRGYLGHTSDPWPARLRVAERALEQAARGQVFIRSWPAQVGRAAVSFGAWLVLAFGTQQPGPGAVNLGAGLVIGQISMISHPFGLVSAWNRYVQRHADVSSPRLSSGDAGRVQWAIVPGPITPTLLLTF